MTLFESEESASTLFPSDADSNAAWVVRAGAQGEAEASNLMLGRASIGWSEVPDMSSVASREQLREIVDGLYPDALAQSRAVTTGQLWAFRSTIAVGDVVVMPLKTQPGSIAFGRCTGTYCYDADAAEATKHYLPVKWQPDLVSRDILQPDLMAMVNGAMTVFSVSRNDAAQRLKAVGDSGVDPGYGSGDGSQEPVRRWLLYRTLLEVLAEHGQPLRRHEAYERVAERLAGQLTDYELATFRDADDTPRWRHNLGWGTTDMAAACWMTKTREGWAITDAGREALASHPDGRGLEVDSGRAYRERLKASRPVSSSQPKYASILEAALEFVEPGEWTSYSDLAAVAATNPQTVGTYMGQTMAEGAYRVLGKDGRPVPGFVWSDATRTGTQREALEEEGVQFDESGTASEAQHIRTEDLRANLEERGVIDVLPRRAWLVRGSSVDGHDLVPAWRRDGYASLRAAKLPEVEPGIGRPELKAIIEEGYSQTSYAAKAAKLDEFHAFLSRMLVGDVIATTSQGRLYVGTITGEAEYMKSPDGLSNLRRSAEWAPVDFDYSELAGELKARLQVQYDVVELTQQLDLLEAMIGAAVPVEEDETPAPALVRQPLVLPEATDELAEGLNVDRAWLQECIELLRDRPQLIFYGPPGTGKTYIAQALAAHLAGDNVRLVQFHPGYSYEDFFEGYRPLEEGGFKLKPGPLRKSVDAARESPSTPYFLIIDEINRGNLAKIFGELYFLLEYRSQNVDLLYATDDDIGFTLPENLFVIGTMNTADRSIALVDAAMRRRFAFVPLHPSEPPTDGVLRRWLGASDLDVAVADLLDELNRRIEDPEFKIGPSYFMRRAVHEPGGLDRAWRTAILPLLEEHHYGDGIDVRARYGLDAIRARMAGRLAVDQTGSDDGEPADPA
ncbi:MAG: AAA family ATPase [Micropruina sp.]|nr:AAA family ATPase [Micropruina sp.]